MANQQKKKVLFEIKDTVGIISLNRPEVLNCFDLDTLIQLRRHLEDAKSDKRVCVVLICGNGRAFSSGMDLKFSKGKDARILENFNRQGLVEAFSYIQRFPKPTIAVVNGFALGGGFELALSCDFRFASREYAIFGFPEINLGILPTWGGLFLPIGFIGISQTMDLVLTGKRIDAETAFVMGLVNYVVSHEQLFDTALSFARELAQKGLFLLQLAKYMIKKSSRESYSERLKLSMLAAKLIIEGENQEARLNSLLDKEEIK